MATEQYRETISDSRQHSGNPSLVWPSVGLAVLLTMLFISAASLNVQPEGGHLSDHHHHDHEASIVSGWEGSAQGVAYSEFNHHLAGLFVLLMGAAELSASLRMSSLSWTRFLVPTAMLFGSVLLMVGSDHDAWPTGSLSFAQTFSGHDPEIFQHKIYGVLLFSVGAIETLRRVGRISDVRWSALLPLCAIGGGLMLFGHSHGVHPSAEKIAMHHAILGTMAVTAGFAKLLSNRLCVLPQGLCSRWEWLWAGLILLIGVQLLIYSE